MSHFELVGGTLAYASTVYALSLVSWAFARLFLPAGTRAGLRLAAIVVGQFVGCAIVVQCLGLIGQFRAAPYLLTTLGAGATVSWVFREDRPHHRLWRLVRGRVYLWLYRSPLGLGYASAAGFLFLAYRQFAYVTGIDSLTIHGPLVAGWTQLGRVELTTNWNYPQCWEYQYAPNFLLLHSDVLVIVPCLLQVGVLLLLVRELACRLGLPGKIASLISLLSVFNPVIWGGTMKNDPAFAVGLLLCVLALERVARGRPGAIWLAQLGSFMVLGTKASGLVYVAPVWGLFLVLWLIRRPRRPGLKWQLIRLLAGTFALQVSAAAVQIYNLVQRGNPTYPIQLEIGGRVIFAGPGDLTGTSILEAGRELQTWILMFRGSMFQLGLDFPFLSLLLVAGLGHATAVIIRDLVRGRRLDPEECTFWALAAANCLLWVLYLATPWSRGTHSDVTQYTRHGESLRYAIGPICLTYVVSAAFLIRRFGRQKVFNLLSSTFLALIFAKWVVRSIWYGPILLVVWKLLALLAAVCTASWVAAALWRLSRRLPMGKRGLVRGLLGAGLAALLLVSYGQRVEEERVWKWELPQRQLWRYVRSEVPSGSIIGTNDKEPHFAYFLLGARLDNEIRRLPLNKARAGGEDAPDFYYLVMRRPGDDRGLRVLKKHGWKPLIASADKKGILLQRPGRGAQKSKPRRAVEPPPPGVPGA